MELGKTIELVGSAKASELLNIIPPEIKDDEFYQLIERLATVEPLDHVLEIGSSAGGGSTSAFLAGLARNPSRPKLHCVEISKPRFAVLEAALSGYPFAYCYNRSTVSVEEFPNPTDVIAFYDNVPTRLNIYPLHEVLRWLQQDIDYVLGADVPADAIKQIKSDHGIHQFDLVLIDGSEFTGDAEFGKIAGARIILLDDTNTYKCHKVRQQLLNDPDYELIVDNQDLRNGFSAFRRYDGKSKPTELPIHFFTIVLNGEPFIRYHETVFSRLDVPWHWHVIEGVADLKHDTAWSVEGGGHVAAGLHDNGRSNDGTSAYLDELESRHADRVTLYRKPSGEFWDGKREMVAAPLGNIDEDCLLWQVDADELWTKQQIETVHAMFMRDRERTAAMYWCWYFVGPRKIISTRYNYAQNPQQEWLRTWRFRPGDRWFAHEPPILTRGADGSTPVDIAKIHPFTQDEMERAGAVFQHFAYALQTQLAFKEVYYGYKNARAQWHQLQEETKPGLLRKHLGWVHDETMCDDIDRYPVDLLARQGSDGAWIFEKDHEQTDRRACGPVLIDGIVWQSGASESRRFWTNILVAWADSGFAEDVIVLDRAGTAPRIEGIHYWTMPHRDPGASGRDSLELERVCQTFGAPLFVSTGNSCPTTTPSAWIAFAAQTLDQADEETRRARLHASYRIIDFKMHDNSELAHEVGQRAPTAGGFDSTLELPFEATAAGLATALSNASKAQCAGVRKLETRNAWTELRELQKRNEDLRMASRSDVEVGEPIAAESTAKSSLLSQFMDRARALFSRVNG